MFWGILLDTGARQLQPGKIGLALSALTGPPTMFWSAITGDFAPVFGGTVTAIGGALLWMISQPENRQIKVLNETVGLLTAEVSKSRQDLQDARKAHEEAEARYADEIAKLRKAHEVADALASEERAKLRIENENFRVQLARVGAGVRRVENIVTPTTTPDPDHAGGDA